MKLFLFNPFFPSSSNRNAVLSAALLFLIAGNEFSGRSEDNGAAPVSKLLSRCPTTWPGINHCAPSPSRLHNLPTSETMTLHCISPEECYVSAGEAREENAEEPVFRPLRRYNWTPFRKRAPRYRSRRVTCPPLHQSAEVAETPCNAIVLPRCGGYENDAFVSLLGLVSPESPCSRGFRAVDGCACVAVRAESTGRAVRPVPSDDGSLARQRNEPAVVAATRLEPGPHHHHHHHPPQQQHQTPHEVLPDILNAHLPPPYATLPPRRHLPPPPPRFRPPRCVVDTEVVEPKHCCGVLVTQTVSIRWFIVMIAFVGLCCAIVGTVLGALKATGREHLTVSLLMIGESSFPNQPLFLLPCPISTGLLLMCNSLVTNAPRRES